MDIKFQPFSYKTLTFLEWMNEMNKHPLFEGKPEWIKILLAARADILASYIDARANNNMFHSMYTKQAVYDFARYLDYIPSTGQCATGMVKVTLKSDAPLPLVVPKNELVFQTSVAVGGAPVVFSAENDFTFNNLVEYVPVKEGQVYSDILPSTFTGEEFEEVVVPRKGLIRGTVSLFINSEIWSEVEYLFNSKPADKHFRIIYYYDGTVKIRGGNGTFGSKFPFGFNGVLTARFGGGVRGNVSEGKINMYIGSNPYILSVINETKMTGGMGEESIDKIKTLAPLLVCAQDRCVSKNDFVAFTLKHGGVSRAYVEPNFAGILSVRIQVIPNGGGVASYQLRNSLTTYLNDKSVLFGIFIQVDTADYQPIDVNMEVLVEDGFTFAQVLPWVRLGTLLIVSEVVAELKEVLASEGIKNAIEYINNLWGFSFDIGDDLVCQKIFSMLSLAKVFEWGENIFTNIFFSMMDLIDGVKSIVLLNPVNIQYVEAGKIPCAGVLTFNEADKPERMCATGINISLFVQGSILFDNSVDSGIYMVTLCDGVI